MIVEGVRHRSNTAIHALVLGGGGFIGSHLLRRLESHAGYARVEIAGTPARGMQGARGWMSGDIDAGLLASCAVPDVVFWAIGGASVGKSVSDPQEDFRRSIPPLVALLDRLSMAWRGARLVFLSSAAVYGAAGTDATPVTAPLMPVSPYGRHKAESERMIQQADSGTGRHRIVRPFSVYGPGLQRQLFWDALQRAARGDLRFAGTGDELRDWLHVDDLASMLADVGAGTCDLPAVSNAGTGRGTRVAEALALLLSFLPSQPVPTFDGNVRAGDPLQLVADPGSLGPGARYFVTPLHEGLAQYVRWFGRSMR